MTPAGSQQESSAVAGAGAQIKTILKALKQHGSTLPSLGLITEQSIAGAISTGTHGSGKNSLSHYIQSVRIARYDPQQGTAIIEEISAGDDLRAARCALGCLGVILSVRIRCRPRYNVQEYWQEYTELTDVLAAENDWPLQQFFLVPWKWSLLAQHRREVPAPRSALAGLYRVYWFLVIDLGLHLLLQLAAKLIRRDEFARFLYRRIIPPFVVRHWRAGSSRHVDRCCC